MAKAPPEKMRNPLRPHVQWRSGADLYSDLQFHTSDITSALSAGRSSAKATVSEAGYLAEQFARFRGEAKDEASPGSPALNESLKRLQRSMDGCLRAMMPMLENSEIPWDEDSEIPWDERKPLQFATMLTETVNAEMDKHSLLKTAAFQSPTSAGRMTTIGNKTLGDFLNGELPPEQLAELEAQLEHDSEHQADDVEIHDAATRSITAMVYLREFIREARLRNQDDTENTTLSAHHRLVINLIAFFDWKSNLGKKSNSDSKTPNPRTNQARFVARMLETVRNRLVVEGHNPESEMLIMPDREALIRDMDDLLKRGRLKNLVDELHRPNKKFSKRLQKERAASAKRRKAYFRARRSG